MAHNQILEIKNVVFFFSRILIKNYEQQLRTLFCIPFSHNTRQDDFCTKCMDPCDFFSNEKKKLFEIS